MSSTTPLDSTHLKEKIALLVQTESYEFVMEPERGSGAREYLFEPNDEAMADALEFILEEAIENAFPDEVEVVDIVASATAENEIMVSISYNDLIYNNENVMDVKVGESVESA